MNREELEREEELKSYPIAYWMRKVANQGFKDSMHITDEDRTNLKKLKYVQSGAEIYQLFFY